MPLINLSFWIIIMNILVIHIFNQTKLVNQSQFNRRLLRNWRNETARTLNKASFRILVNHDATLTATSWLKSNFQSYQPHAQYQVTHNSTFIFNPFFKLLRHIQQRTHPLEIWRSFCNFDFSLYDSLNSVTARQGFRIDIGHKKIYCLLALQAKWVYSCLPYKFPCPCQLHNIWLY